MFLMKKQQTNNERLFMMKDTKDMCMYVLKRSSKMIKIAT